MVKLDNVSQTASKEEKKNAVSKKTDSDTLPGLDPKKKRKIAQLSDDTDFIRGKATHHKAPSHKDGASLEDNIFKEVADESVAKSKVVKTKSDTEFGKPLEEISYKKLSVGTLVMGVISEIGELDVVVNLPFGLTGFISGTEISSEFNNMLKGSNEDDDTSQELDLCDVLSVGQYIVSSVVSVTEVAKSKKVNLTIKPEVVNSNVKMQDVKKNMVLQAVVQSEEDYGYMVNTGITGVRAFLPKSETTTHKPCDIVRVVVKSATDGNLQLEVYDGKTKVLSEKCITTFTSLLPGHVVQAVVKKNIVNGIRCSLLSGIQGAMHTIHLKDMLSTKSIQDVYPEKRKLTARVLLINPTNKNVLLSVLPCHVAMEAPCFSLKKGDVLEDLEVVKVVKRGVYLQVDSGVVGFAHMSKLLDKELEKIPANFKMGTLHKARVMGFRLADNIIQLSLRSSDLSKPFLSYHDIDIGRVVSATVVTIEDFGLVVKLADNIRGVVTKIHLADITIKHPELKFKEKQKVKAKVLSVDPVKRRLNLTLKRSIIKNSTANVTSFETLEKNQHVTGWVAAIKDFGIIMNFSNKLRGLVHCSDISNVPITAADIGKLYKIGQVLTCRVSHVDAAKEKLSLSLNLLEESDGTSRPAQTNWARKSQIHSCTVLENKADGLRVQLDTTKEEAFLPLYHLSDHKSLNQRKLLHLKSGSTLTDVLVIDKKMKKIIVSAKSSILSWAKAYETPPKITDFKVGDFVPGFIKDFQDYGCFVEIGNGLVGLCPKACLADSFVSDPRALFGLGDSVVCKITNIDTEKGRFLVSLKMSDVRSDASMSGGSLLNNFFSEMNQVFGDVEHEPIGSIAECVITRHTEQGYSVKVGELAGFVSRDSADEVTDDVTNGSSGPLRGVVLDFDPSQALYLLNTKREFVEKMEGSGKKKKLSEGSHVTGHVVAVTECYFVVLLPEHGCRFGFVSRRVHINDVTRSNIACNDTLQLTVFRAKRGKPLLLSVKQEEINDIPSRKRKLSDEKNIKFDDIKLGEMYTVTVKSVKTMQLNVQLSRKVHGRVHITEVTDNPTPGANPLAEFKHGNTFEAKLIGFRHSKTYRYLPITRTDYQRSMGELSLRSSSTVKEIKDGEKVDEVKDVISTLNVGDTVTGFVRSVDPNGFVWISITPGVEGRLYHTLSSAEKEEVEQWQERFTVGQCLSATVFSTRDNRLDLSLVGPIEVDRKFWCKVSGFLPGIGLKVQVSARDWGIVPMTEINDTYAKDPMLKYKEDTLVQCVVLEKPSGSSKRLTLSLRKSRTSQRWKKNVGGKKIVNPVINSAEELEDESVYSGYVKSTSATAGIYVALGSNVTGRVLLKNMSDNFLKNWEPMFPLGKLVRVYVVHKSPKVELSMKLSDLKKGAKKEEDDDEDNEEMVQKCLDDLLLEKYQNSDDDDDVIGGDDSVREEESNDESVGEVEDLPKIVFTSDKSKGESKGVIKDSVIAAGTEVEDHSDDEEQKEEIKETEEKRGKSYQKREKRRKKDEEEQAIRQIETKRSTSLPETQDEFEREVASKPDASSTWVCYMAYWLGLSNVDKARLTARRALETINYRLEEEKLNIWSALFNLENSFGTHDSLMKCCQEAAAVNDSKAVFLRLAAVLDKSGKYQELEEVYSSVLLKKFKRSRKVWTTYGTSLAVQSNLDKMREQLPRALKALSKHKHIRTICHFAQLEYKHGDGNRGSTMFENILNSYPGRLDLWALYMDKTVAIGDVDQSRLLLDRAVSLKLPAKKMNFFFKRYIEFESKHGDEARLQSIKDKAREYLTSNDQDDL